MNEQGIPQLTAQQRASMTRQRDTPGIPLLPPGSKLATTLASLVERVSEVTVAGRAARSRANELEARKRLAATGNVKKLAAAMRAGEDGPTGASEVPAIEAEIREESTRVDAAVLATELAQGDIATAVRAGAIAFVADLEALEESQRQGVLEAIDVLEAAWWALSETRGAREWVLKGGKPTTASVVQPVVPRRGDHLTSVLEGLRAVFDQPRKQPRPTTDPDGTPRSGWEAYGKLAQGGNVVGTFGNRRPAGSGT